MQSLLRNTCSMLLLQRLRNKCYWKKSRKNTCFEIDFWILFIKKRTLKCCSLFITCTCPFNSFCRTKHVYKHWKDMLRTCLVSASILNCLSSSRAQKMVIAFFCYIRDRGGTYGECFAVVWPHIRRCSAEESNKARIPFF